MQTQEHQQILPEGLKPEKIKKVDRRDEIMDELEESLKTSSILEGRVVGITQNSHGKVLKVDYSGMEFVLPEEELDPKKANPDRYLGRAIFFKVLGLDKKNYTAVLSRKKAAEERQNTTWDNIQLDEIRIGKVIKLDERHAVLDIGGITALLNRDDYSYARTPDLTKVLELGEGIDVKVIELDRKRSHCRVSVKEILGDPWDIVKDQIKEGDLRTGIVVRQYTNPKSLAQSAFIRLDPFGVTVMTRKPANWELPEPKTEVVVRVSKIDSERKRIYGILLRRANGI